MNTPTKTIKTPISEHEVILKTFITGRERRDLTNVFLTGDLSFSADAKDVKGLKGSLVAQAEDLAIKTVVMAVDGKEDNVVNAVLDMHAQDYAFVIAEVNKVTSDAVSADIKKN